MDERQKIQLLQEVSGISDPEQCVRLLEAHNWDVDSTLGTIFAEDISEIQPAGPSHAPGLRSRFQAPPPIPNEAEAIVSSRRHVNSSVAGRNPTLLWKILKLPFRVFRITVSYVVRGIGFGFWAAGAATWASLHSVTAFTRWAVGGPGLPAQSEQSLFRHRFEEEYGPYHPDFIDMSINEVVRMCGEQDRLLFVYLHSAHHEHTPTFCSETLCSERVVNYLNQNFVVWGGDVRGSQGFKMSRTFGAASFPFYCVLKPRPNSQVQVIRRVDSLTSPEAMLAILQDALELQSAFVAQAQAGEVARMADRQLRMEQDEAYRAALIADQEKARKLKEEEQKLEREKEEAERLLREEEERQRAAEQERAFKEAQLKKRCLEKAAQLGTEPEKGPGVTQVLVRFPSGERRERRFHNTATVKSLYDFVDSLSILKTTKYSLSTNFPRVVFGPDTLGQTLVEAGLHPHASMYVIQMEDED